MSSFRSVSCCTFTFSDGRRCRTPRQSGHPQSGNPLFCYFHARKHRQSQAADQLGNDFLFLLSGDHISACDLAAALSRLFAGVARGDIKPRTASTLAYLAQTLLLTIQIAEKEYADAFGPQALRKVVATHVRENQEYLRKGSAQPVAQPGIADHQVGAPAPAPNPAPQPQMLATSSADSSLAPLASSPTVNSQPTPQPLGQAAQLANPAPELPAGNTSPVTVLQKPATQPATQPATKPATKKDPRPRHSQPPAISQPPVKTAQATSAQAPANHFATGPSGLPLLAPLPLQTSQKPSPFQPGITPLPSTLPKVYENK